MFLILGKLTLLMVILFSPSLPQEEVEVYCLMSYKTANSFPSLSSSFLSTKFMGTSCFYPNQENPANKTWFHSYLYKRDITIYPKRKYQQHKRNSNKFMGYVKEKDWEKLNFTHKISTSKLLSPKFCWENTALQKSPERTDDSYQNPFMFNFK